jgi:hypothetical protein
MTTLIDNPDEKADAGPEDDTNEPANDTNKHKA